jgi:hypothetical protein
MLEELKRRDRQIKPEGNENIEEANGDQNARKFFLSTVSQCVLKRCCSQG